MSFRTGDGMKLPSLSKSIIRGRTCSSTAQCIQEEFAHCVIGFRQSGHCSAPRISVPPFFSPPPLLLLLPPPEAAELSDFLSLPQAAASSPTQKTSARSLKPRRCRVTKMDLLVGLHVRPFCRPRNPGRCPHHRADAERIRTLPSLPGVTL